MTTRRKLVLAGASAPLVFRFSPLFAKEPFPLEAFIRDLEEIVRIDSKTGHEEGVNEIAGILEKRFTSIGWATMRKPFATRGDLFLASNTPGFESFDVILCAHADTVQPVGNAAKYPLRIDAGNIAHGAGVADDKSSLTALWWICKMLPKDLLGKLKIAVVVNPGEESGSPEIRSFLTDFGSRAPVAMVYEPGRPGGGCVKARKGALALELRFKGLTAHAGNNPEMGRNAIEAMALAIPQVKAIARKYRDVTLNADIVEGGTTVNSIADRAMVKFDFRFFDDETRDKVVADVQALCDAGFAPGVSTELHYGSSSALPYTEKSAKVVALVNQAARDLGQAEPQWLSVGGASDGNKFAGGGAAVVCAMGVVGGDLHNPEKEWSDLNTVEPRIALGIRTLELLAARK